MKLMPIIHAFILSYRSKNYGISLWYRKTETGRLLGSFGCRGNIFHLPDGSSWAQIGHYPCSSETGNGSTPSYTTWYWWNVKMKKRVFLVHCTCRACGKWMHHIHLYHKINCRVCLNKWHFKGIIYVHIHVRSKKNILPYYMIVSVILCIHAFCWFD